MARHLILAALALALSGCGAGAVSEPTTGVARPHPESPSALFEQGRDAARRGDSVRAEQYLTLAVERGYPREKALPLLLEACIASSRLRAALDHAESYLRQHPEHQGLRYLVATLYASLGQAAQAEVELEQLLRANSRHPEAHYLAGVLAEEVNGEQAREHFRQYLAIAPSGRRAAEVRSRLSELAVHEALGRREVVR
jgi:tetratricopeptide (TPR) repeat protein